MENEELFAGEPALDAQQQVLDGRHTAVVTKNTPLRVHDEPLLDSEDSEDDWLQRTQLPRDLDNRPRWRRPHVSDSGRSSISLSWDIYPNCTM